MFGRKNVYADYFFVERTQGSGKLQLEAETYCDKTVLRLMQYIKGEEPTERENRRLEKMIRRRCRKSTIIYGSEEMLRELGLPNVLFQARKLEFLQYVDDILMFLDGEGEKKNRHVRGCAERKQFLVVVNSKQWSYRELTRIVTSVKEMYEDVYILPLIPLPHLDEMKEFFCDEYGVVLHIVSEAEAMSKEMDGIFFLLEYWDKRYTRFPYKKGYVMCEWEQGLRRVRRTLDRRKSQVQHNVMDGVDVRSQESKEEEQEKGRERIKSVGSLYSGFVYHVGKTQLSYELAVLLRAQGDILYGERPKEENAISIVAIYGVE